MNKPVCAVIGIGPGNGAAIARRFHREGHAVGMISRGTELAGALAAELGDGARAYRGDAAVPASLEAALTQVTRDLGEVDVLVYNAGSGVWGTIEEITAAQLEAAWRVNALGAAVAAQVVIPAMKRKRRGSIVLVGATASRRGGPRSAAFSSAKAAQRSLGESMARHLWPLGIHVAVVIIDGVVDLASTRARMPDKPDTFFVQPDAIAEAIHAITRQPPSAWSFEVEARPFGETW